MDIWDYYYRQNELAFSHKVSDSALTCLKLNVTGGGYHNTGKLVAIGDQDGTVTLMELCDSLYMVQPKEKEIITEVITPPCINSSSSSLLTPSPLSSSYSSLFTSLPTILSPSSSLLPHSISFLSRCLIEKTEKRRLSTR